jgi:tetratricopeptide (TPR) repeat protein
MSFPVQSPEQAIDLALDARDAGRGEDALPLLKAAIAEHPRNPRLWQTLGVLHRALNDSAAAVEAFTEAARLTPADLKPVYGVAQASLEAGRPATALFERARALAPGDGSLLLGRAAAQIAEGHADEAINGLADIVRNNPLWFDGQATLARLRWLAGDLDGFADGYRQALTGMPQSAALWSELVNLLIHVERYADAAAAIGQAQAAIDTPDALMPLEAACAAELGETDRADRLFAALAGRADIGIVERHLRHLLRTRRADAAAALAERWRDHAEANRIWPYVSLAWRLTGDKRIDWLEGDPALIGVVDLDIADLLAPLAERLRALHRAKAAPLGQSVRGGTQTDGPLFAREEPEIRKLRAAIVDAVRGHVGGIGPRDAAHPTRRYVGRGFGFSGSWSVRLTGAGHHSNHIHPQGWISSAFYVALPPPADMGPEPAGWLQLGAPPHELGLDLPAYRTIEPVAGRLILFPSTMWHGTLPFAAGERLTVAFDVAAAG